MRFCQSAFFFSKLGFRRLDQLDRLEVLVLQDRLDVRRLDGQPEERSPFLLRLLLLFLYFLADLARPLALRVEPHPLHGHLVDDHLAPEQVQAVHVERDAPAFEAVRFRRFGIGDLQVLQGDAEREELHVRLHVHLGADDRHAHLFDHAFDDPVDEQEPEAP